MLGETYGMALSRSKVFALRTCLSLLLTGCATEGDSPEESSAESAEASEQQLSVSEPLRGIYHWDAPNGPLLVDEAAKWLGREQDLGLAFTARDKWSDVTGPAWQLSAWSQWVQAKPGRKLVYSISLLPGPTNGAGPDGALNTGDDVSLQKCSDGQYDAQWKTLANNLVSYGLPDTILRLGWEFNGDWFAWGAPGKEAQFAGCFRRVVSAMRAAQPSAPFKFDWNPTEDIVWWSQAQVDAAWPGDAYVDYIGVDAYDASWVANSFPYPGSCDAACRSARQNTAWTDVSKGLIRMRDMAVAHGKLLSVPEWGVWGRDDGHGGGDNPLYIAKMHEFMTNPSNRVAYQIYFDVNWEDGGHQISDVAGSGATTGAQHTYKTVYPEAAAKFKALFSSAPTPAPAPAPVDAGTPPGPTLPPDAGVRVDAGLPAVDAGTPLVDAGKPASDARAPVANVALVNGGFESKLSGWTSNGAANVVSTGTHSGSSALCISKSSGAAEQDVMRQLSVGASYKLTAFAKLGKTGETAAVGMKFLNGAGTVLGEYYAMVSSTTYAQKTLQFVVPTGATRAVVYAYKAAGNGASATFDDNVLARQ
ncbi:MAG: hypothetical protein RLZZ450_4635 [Pseudomonadota bacterium]